MAGQPRRRALIAELERRTRETFEDSDAPKASHLDYVCLWVESGRTMRQLAKEIETKAGVGDMPDAMLGNYLRNTFTDATERLTAARAIGAHAMLEETADIADETVLSSEDAARARNRIGARQYLGGVWNPETSPKRAHANANAALAGVGVLLLDALRGRASTTAVVVDSVSKRHSTPSQQSATEDANVVSIEDAQRDVIPQLSDVL